MQNKSKHWCLAVLVLAFLLFFSRDVAAEIDFDALKKSVVRILTQTNEGIGTGTGFVINDQGYIATNVHVIDDGNLIKAIPTNSNRMYDVDVIALFQELDLAIVHAPGINLPPLTLSPSSLKAGQKVWAIGYPGGADKRSSPSQNPTTLQEYVDNLATDPTVQDGVIGLIRLGAWSKKRLEIIQHNAATNPGNSGGPLLDDCGRVIGVNTQASLVHVPTPTEDGGMKLVRVPHAAGIYWSSHIKELVKLLGEHGKNNTPIPFQSLDNPCLSALEKLQGRTDATIEELKKAVKEAEEARNQVKEMHKLLTETIQKSQAAERQSRIWMIVLGGLTLVALVLALKKPRQQLVHVVEQMSRPIGNVVEQISRPIKRGRDGAVQRRPAEQRPARGLVLAGFDGRGNRVHIALSPEKFAGQRLGLSLGRQPELVDEVVNDEHVSRRHLRISFRDHQFYIEDLNSSNGTFLNQHRLSPFTPELLDYGATVALGGLEVMVSKL